MKTFFLASSKADYFKCLYIQGCKFFSLSLKSVYFGSVKNDKMYAWKWPFIMINRLLTRSATGESFIAPKAMTNELKIKLLSADYF